MGVEVRGHGHNSVEEGDHVAGVNTPIILRLLLQSTVLYIQFIHFKPKPELKI